MADSSFGDCLGVIWGWVLVVGHDFGVVRVSVVAGEFDDDVALFGDFEARHLFEEGSGFAGEHWADEELEAA